MQVALEWGKTCAILDNDVLKCWGSGGHGALGIPNDTTNRGHHPGTMGDSLQPVDVGTNLRPVKVAVGQTFACAVLYNANNTASQVRGPVWSTTCPALSLQ